MPTWTGVILISEVDQDVNRAGVKGLGELADVGTAGAIGNAMRHATAIPVRRLPIRLEDLLQAQAQTQSVFDRASVDAAASNDKLTYQIL